MAHFARLLARARRPLVMLAGALLLVGAGACAASSERTVRDDGVAAEAPAAQVDATAEHRRGHHHAPLRRIFEAVVEHGDLSAHQEATVLAIQADLRDGHEARRQGREELRAAAVDIVRSGTADSGQFRGAVDRATAAVEQRMKAYSDALVELHAILDVAQRASVAGALRERIEKRWGKRHERRHRKGLERVVAYLMLSQLQLDELRAMHRELMGPRQRLRPSRDELESLLTAFEGEQFEATLDAFQAEKVAILKQRLARAGEHTDTVLALLDRGQRELLADLIERGPRSMLLEQPPN